MQTELNPPHPDTYTKLKGLVLVGIRQTVSQGYRKSGVHLLQGERRAVPCWSVLQCLKKAINKAKQTSSCQGCLLHWILCSGLLPWVWAAHPSQCNWDLVTEATWNGDRSLWDANTLFRYECSRESDLCDAAKSRGVTSRRCFWGTLRGLIKDNED